MKIAVHFNDNMRLDNFAFRWEEELKKRNIIVQKVNLKSYKALNLIKDCDGVMWHWTHNPNDKQIAPKILYIIEKYLKIPTYPNHDTYWHYDDKIAQYFLFEYAQIKKIPTWIFWNYHEAVEFLKNSSYPLVFKLSIGASSENVIKINNLREGLKITNILFKRGVFPPLNKDLKTVKTFVKSIQKTFVTILKFTYFSFFNLHYYLPKNFIPQKNYVYFQKFIDNNPYDIRIWIIGNRAFGGIRYNRHNDFRASGSGFLDYSPENIPVDAIKTSFRLSNKFNFQTMSYDYLYYNNDILLNEISYCYVNSAVKNCPGYWDENLKWHNVSMWPEEAHIIDFLNIIKEIK